MTGEGISSDEAARRLARDGANEIRREHGTPAWRCFVRQFASPVILLLLGAAVVSGILGELADAVAIAAIVVINAVIGFIQEYRAERAVLALRAMTAPRAHVVRDGVRVAIPAAEVVIGDVLVLEAGDIVAADAAVIDANVLSANEAPLTGESTPVDKNVDDEVYLGTSVASGTGSAVVVATGMATKLGLIANLLQTTTEEATPLQRRLSQLSRTLLVASAAIVGVVALAGVLRGAGMFEVFLSAVALAVAAIPEGLPAIVTIALAIGVRRMAARNALVRKLPAVETLGCTTVICTDKTGTLTTGVMAVRELWGPDHQRLLDAASACSDAELSSRTGDTTELAILAEADLRGIRRETIERERPRVEVNPFDSERKRMSIRRGDGLLYVKGAVEVVLARCTSGGEGAGDAAAQLAARGLRVLAVAVGTTGEEANLTLLGLIGIADPPRTEAIDAVAAAGAAGIRTVMITGDHPITARVIARELGIEADLVHARATPQDKLAIVRDWKARGAIVAMTGDGVNDAPALREAHVGIAMGKAGTEVAREVADIVLADDNFASIVAAIREGRGIVDNIRKVLVYLLSGNVAELAVMLIASIAGLPLPLLPLQLLWVNLVTDGLPALALAMDPPEHDVMTHPPRSHAEPILGRPEWISVLATGTLQTGVVLATFVWALRARDVTSARNFAFTVLVFGELFRSFASRSTTKVFWQVGVLTNLGLLAVVAASACAQFAIHQLQFTERLVGARGLSLAECGAALVIGLIPVTVIEIAKLAAALHERKT
jgi:Ca2+-transporting ATPase